MTAGAWVSVEGINGVGKSHLARRLAAQLGADCMLVSELTDHATDTLTGKVIAALNRPDSTFLRTGHPITETFALMALKVYEYEHVSQHLSQRAPLVLEDRGPDSVAVYQAAILAGERSLVSHLAIMDRIIETVATWRALPVRTILLVDERDECLRRYTTRLGTRLTRSDYELVALVDQLYRELAAANPARIHVIDRSHRTENDVLSEMRAICQAAMGEDAS